MLFQKQLYQGCTACNYLGVLGLKSRNRQGVIISADLTDVPSVPSVPSKRTNSTNNNNNLYN